jgi:hypothetical protein
MTGQDDPLRDALQRQRALSRWDDDGGAEPGGKQPSAEPAKEQQAFPRLGDAEIQALHVRVIALENLVIALLAAASDKGREQGRNMAAYITPRPGFTRHKLTIHAAAHMVDLVDRAQRFTSPEPGG